MFVDKKEVTLVHTHTHAHAVPDLHAQHIHAGSEGISAYTQVHVCTYTRSLRKATCNTLSVTAHAPLTASTYNAQNNIKRHWCDGPHAVHLASRLQLTNWQISKPKLFFFSPFLFFPRTWLLCIVTKDGADGMWQNSQWNKHYIFSPCN